MPLIGHCRLDALRPKTQEHLVRALQKADHLCVLGVRFEPLNQIEWNEGNPSPEEMLRIIGDLMPQPIEASRLNRFIRTDHVPGVVPNGEFTYRNVSGWVTEDPMDDRKAVTLTGIGNDVLKNFADAYFCLLNGRLEELQWTRRS